MKLSPKRLPKPPPTPTRRSPNALGSTEFSTNVSNPSLLRQSYTLLRAEASSWRRRKYRSLILTLVSTLLMVLFLWSSERFASVFFPSSQSLEVSPDSLARIPSCNDDVFMEPTANCYTLIYAPNTTEFRDVVGRLGVPERELRGFRSGVDMDAYLYEHPNTVLAAVEFFRESATKYAFSVQTNGTARWFKGAFFNRDTYVQLPVIVGVQRAMSRFLDGKSVEVGLRKIPMATAMVMEREVVGASHLSKSERSDRRDRSDRSEIDILLPLFYISSSILILIMQVHDTVEKHGVIDVLHTHGLSRTAAYVASFVQWTNLCFLNSAAFVGAYALVYLDRNTTWYDVSLMMTCGQAMAVLGLLVGASVREKGSVLGVGVMLFFWSWLSVVGGFASGGAYAEYVTPWGLLVVGLREGGWATLLCMWVLTAGYAILGWAVSVRVWRWVGRSERWSVGSGLDSDSNSKKASPMTVQVAHLRRRFGQTLALDDVSLELAAGEEKVVLGTCSAGKSTLLRSILDERCPFVWRARGLMVGYCPQEPRLLAHVTVDEWLRLVRDIRGIRDACERDFENGQDDERESGEGKTELHKRDTERDTRMIWELNAGERRWVALQTAIIGMLPPPASCLSSKTTRESLVATNRLVLLDEPTSEMSPELKRMTWKKIQELKKAGCSVLVATHDVDEAERGDEIIVLSRGVSVFTGTELELRRRFGCGYQLNIRVSSTMVQGASSVHSLVMKALGSKKSNVTSTDGYCTFDVPHEMEDRLPRLLTTLDMNKTIFGVEDVQLRAATISNSFMALIRQTELEAAVREGRYELLLVAEEGIALKIPIGSDLVESPSGCLYQLVWSTEPRSGKLTIASYSRVPM